MQPLTTGMPAGSPVADAAAGVTSPMRTPGSTRRGSRSSGICQRVLDDAAASHLAEVGAGLQRGRNIADIVPSAQHPDDPVGLMHNPSASGKQAGWVLGQVQDFRQGEGGGDLDAVRPRMRRRAAAHARSASVARRSLYMMPGVSGVRVVQQQERAGSGVHGNADDLAPAPQPKCEDTAGFPAPRWSRRRGLAPRTARGAQRGGGEVGSAGRHQLPVQVHGQRARATGAQVKTYCDWKSAAHSGQLEVELPARGLGARINRHHNFGSSFMTAGPGRATTCAAISLPRPSTFSWPAATAAVTADSSPWSTTVT